MTKKENMIFDIQMKYEKQMAAIVTLKELNGHNQAFVAVIDDLGRRVQKQFNDALLVTAMLDDDGRVNLPYPGDDHGSD